MEFEVFIGWDPREELAWRVANASMLYHARRPVGVTPIWRQQLERLGLYRRPTIKRGNVIWDVISDKPCASEFSIARFGVPMLARAKWALFIDLDFLFRADVYDLFALADERYAVMAVKHDHRPVERQKMDGQTQLQYPRKNWSSCMLWNTEHPAHEANWNERLNCVTGLELHSFFWLDDTEIGALPESWNWLDGHSDPAISPKAVHFTRGTPDMPGYEHTRYAPEWNRYAASMLRDEATKMRAEV